MVVVHGGPGAPGSAAPLARALGRRFRVLEPLQRPSGGEPLSVARHVADLDEVVRRLCGDERPGVVGHSWGAMLALSFAAAHPDRVRSLALVGCGTYDEASRSSYEQALASRLGEEGRRRAKELRRQSAAAAGEEERDRVLAALGRLLGRAQACDPLPEEEGEPLWVDARGHAETWADARRLQAAGVEPAAFAAVTCPVLMLHGDDDPHPGPATCDLLRRFVPQLRYRGLPSCGHKPWAERRAREPFLAALGEWLRDETSRGSSPAASRPPGGG